MKYPSEKNVPQLPEIKKFQTIRLRKTAFCKGYFFIICASSANEAVEKA
jgi:hypothetical protein